LAQAADPLPSADVDVSKLPAAQPIQEKLPIKEEAVVDLKHTFKKFNDIADRILDNFGSDRDEIEETIASLKDLFNQNSKPQEHIVMGLVSALRTKAEANASIIKLLDSFARLVGATKNTNIFQSSSTIIDLSSLLDEDADGDKPKTT